MGALESLVKTDDQIGIRYRYSPHNRMHLVEISPSTAYHREDVSQCESALCTAVGDIDLTQVVVFVPAGESELRVTEPDFESTHPVASMTSFTGQLWYSSETLARSAAGEEHFALAA